MIFYGTIVAKRPRRIANPRFISRALRAGGFEYEPANRGKGLRDSREHWVVRRPSVIRSSNAWANLIDLRDFRPRGPYRGRLPGSSDTRISKQSFVAKRSGVSSTKTQPGPAIILTGEPR